MQWEGQGSDEDWRRRTCLSYTGKDLIHNNPGRDTGGLPGPFNTPGSERLIERAHCDWPAHARRSR